MKVWHRELSGLQRVIRPMIFKKDIFKMLSMMRLEENKSHPHLQNCSRTLEKQTKIMHFQ